MIHRSTDAAAPAASQDLARALETGEIEVWYQPTVRLADGMVTGFEALARWRHPELGVLPAAAFVGLAEAAGLLERLDAWVQDVALAQIAAWQEDAVIGAGFRIALNRSGLVLNHTQLTTELAAAIGRTGVDPRGILIEFHDTYRIVDPSGATRAALGLRALGVGLALDDFGADDGTYQLLKSLPLDALPVGRAVVADCDGPLGETFIRAVVDLAGPLAARTVATGVEAAWQADRLRDAGCQEARGFLWSPAVPADAAERLLTTGWS